MYFIYFPKDFELCSDNDVECHLEKFIENKKKIYPNPRHYELSEDFIFVEQEWGSLFYKHIGKRTRSEAKNLCSSAGPSVHLPIPRFYEEQEFYKTHFGDENLWLDLTFHFSEGIKSTNDHHFIRLVQMYSKINGQDEENSSEIPVRIDYHEWIQLARNNLAIFEWPNQDVFMNDDGQWDWTNETVLFDAVCVYDIIPDESCSKCQNESFCRYKDTSRKETECVCKKTTAGDNCQIDLCSKCQNGGFCDFKDATNEVRCICSFPFYGEFCEGKSYLLI